MIDTEKSVRRLLSEIALVPANASADANLYLDLGVASVHAMELLNRLEQHFKISIPDEDFVEAGSIRALTQLIVRLTGGGAQP